jgi:hypothetical protein
MPFKASQERRHRNPKQRHRVTNCAVYDASLRAWGSLTVWFTTEAIEAWVPDHSTLSRRAETLEVPRPKAGSAPVHLLVDGTGLKLYGPGEWLAEKHGCRCPPPVYV